MTTSRPETAIIYQFPARPNRTAGSRLSDERSVLEQQEQRLPTVEFGSGWYHEAAIRDAQRPRKL